MVSDTSNNNVVASEKNGSQQTYFKPGNRLGPGNPYMRQISDYKRIAYEHMTKERFLEIWCNLVDMATNHKSAWVRLHAIREVFDRLLGTAQPATPDQFQALQVNIGFKPLDVASIVGGNGHSIIDSANGNGNGNGSAAPHASG